PTFSTLSLHDALPICRALVQGKEIQCMHKIVSQTRIDSLRIVFRLQLRLIDADKLFAFARILAKTVVSDSVKPCGKSRLTAKARSEEHTSELQSRGHL